MPRDLPDATLLGRAAWHRAAGQTAMPARPGETADCRVLPQPSAVCRCAGPPAERLTAPAGQRRRWPGAAWCAGLSGLRLAARWTLGRLVRQRARLPALPPPALVADSQLGGIAADCRPPGCTAGRRLAEPQRRRPRRPVPPRSCRRQSRAPLPRRGRRMHAFRTGNARHRRRIERRERLFAVELAGHRGGQRRLPLAGHARPTVAGWRPAPDRDRQTPAACRRRSARSRTRRPRT